MKKRVLITGSSRGIGKSVAQSLARDGVVHGRTMSEHLQETLAELKQEFPQSSALVFDVVERQRSKQILEEDISENGAYYGVVLSVGIHRDQPFPAMTDEAWDEVLKVDLDGFYNILRPLVLPMIQLRAGGRIVPIASFDTSNCG